MVSFLLNLTSAVKHLAHNWQICSFLSFSFCPNFLDFIYHDSYIWQFCCQFPAVRHKKKTTTEAIYLHLGDLWLHRKLWRLQRRKLGQKSVKYKPSYKTIKSKKSRVSLCTGTGLCLNLASFNVEDALTYWGGGKSYIKPEVLMPSLTWPK